MEKKKKILLCGGIVLVGIGLYEYSKKKGQLVSVTTVDNGQTTTTVQPSTPLLTNGQSQQSVYSGGAFGTDNTPITSQVNQAVMAWVNADGRPPIVAIGQARIPSEFNAMYQIIQGGWNPTPDQRQWWNDLIAKYDPQHKYL